MVALKAAMYVYIFAQLPYRQNFLSDFKEITEFSGFITL